MTAAGGDQDVREAFRPALRRDRRLGRAVVGVGAAGVGLLVLGASMPWPATLWLMLGFLLCVVTALAVAITAGGVKCPRCRGLPLHGLGPFCPECGAPGLSARSWLNVPHCGVCGRDMRHGRGGRKYVIRACTHCGAWLNDDGL
jgi:hypothetical protein